MLVLHRAKLLASNQSVLALGVAPSGVRVAAPHSARHGRRACMPKGSMQGCIQVVEHNRCRTHRQQTTTVAEMQSQQSIHSLSPGKGVFGKDAEIRTHQALHEAKPSECPKGIGIINQKFISKTDFFYKLYPRLLMQSGVNIKCDDYLYLPFWIFFINCRCDISPVLTFQESSCSSFQLL